MKNGYKPHNETDNNAICDYTRYNESMLFNQKRLDDLVRELHLTKAKCELLVSRLRKYNMLENCVKITNYRLMHECFADLYHMSESLCFCIDVYSLFERLMILHEQGQWRIFINSVRCCKPSDLTYTIELEKQKLNSFEKFIRLKTN